MVDNEIKTQKSEMTLYNSDASENGYVWCNAINDYIYIESEAMERVDALSKEEIEALIEEGVAFVWDNDAEWGDFESNVKHRFDTCVGVALDGHVKRWNGVFRGGRVYVDSKATFDKIFNDLWKDADGMKITLEDGDMHIHTYNHDGGLTFVLRFLTDEAIDYYEKNPNGLDISDLMAMVMEMSIKADKFLEGIF